MTLPLLLLFAQTGALSIHITCDQSQVGEGENVVVSALAEKTDGTFAAGVMLHARLNHKDWAADYRTSPAGVAHLVIPMPETGSNSIEVTDGSTVSNSVPVRVTPRRFEQREDPNHEIILEYETWFGPGYAQWGHEEAVPLLGPYSSLDPRVVRQHALWFEDLGIDAVEVDWTNNLTEPFPSPAAKECIASTDVLLETYSSMRRHPKVLFMLGPEHNQWSGPKDVYAGPWFKQQIDYLYDHYLKNPRFAPMFLRYQGKPLVLLYLNGPRSGPPAEYKEGRFTIRYVGAWLQTTHQENYGVWSWYDQRATPVLYHGAVEALTVTSGYPSPNAPAGGLNNWLSQDAGGKNDGETYKTQWEQAIRSKPRFLFINQWNEFEPPDQYSANLSNDLEPTLITDSGDPRPSGWSFLYYELTKQEIRGYREALRR